MIVYLAAGDPLRVKYLRPSADMEHCLFTYWDKPQREISLPFMERAKRRELRSVRATPSREEQLHDVLDHPTVLKGTHNALACTKCPRVFRYGVDYENKHPCECGGKLKWHKPKTKKKGRSKK